MCSCMHAIIHGRMDGCCACVCVCVFACKLSLNAHVAHPGTAQSKRTWRGPESCLTRVGHPGLRISENKGPKLSIRIRNMRYIGIPKQAPPKFEDLSLYAQDLIVGA